MVIGLTDKNIKERKEETKMLKLYYLKKWDTLCQKNNY